jgi:tRNA(Ile)-lysidine synthase
MVNHSLPKEHFEVILAVSGGADSVYLLEFSRQKFRRLLVGHYNHSARGRESEADQRFVESLCKDLGLSMEVGKAHPEATVYPPTGRKGKVPPRFEEKARETRYAFLKDLLERHEAKKILVAHTADDQVETVLMRILEGAGITGLKGIPRITGGGIERPLLDTWREDILKYLRKHKIPFRVDRSNLDTRFERNWIRYVLIPLLEKRYGKSVKKRIYALGERFRELDSFIEKTAYIWLENNAIYKGKSRKTNSLCTGGQEKKAIRIPRQEYAALPSLLRIRILQILCYGRIGTVPNERLLTSMDRLIVSGGSSALLSVGRGASLRCRYGEAVLSPPGKKETSGAGAARFGRPGKGKEHKGRRVEEKRGKAGKKKGLAEPVCMMEGPGIYRWNQPVREGGGVEAGYPVSFLWEERGKTMPGRIRKTAQGERQAVFDAELLPLPLSVRPLRAGDRVRPFGLEGHKKVKEILIDRKVPREERWGRPVVCDAGGRVVWIPGILRSSEAAVTPATRRTIVLRADSGGEPLP